MNESAVMKEIWICVNSRRIAVSVWSSGMNFIFDTVISMSLLLSLNCPTHLYDSCTTPLHRHYAFNTDLEAVYWTWTGLDWTRCSIALIIHAVTKAAQ